MKHFALALGIFVVFHSGAFAQSGNTPAELPPVGFEGREYTDSLGCVFLRSTFGGQVTWIPRYGPDRRPICGATPTAVVTAEPPVANSAPAPVASAPVASAPVASTVQPVAAPARAPARAQSRTAPTPARAPRRSAPRPDASGRHPSCPEVAPYGQLVDTALGRPMVRCVTSPTLFLDEYFEGAQRKVPGGATHVTGAARGGRVVQVGSFGVPSNATRLRARLQNEGMPARIYQSRGLNVVTVGPFSSADSAHRALASVRQMGFGDAFLR